MKGYKQDEKFEQMHTKAIVYVARNEESEKITYGDELLFYSYLNTPNDPKNPKEFNYKRYLSAKNIYLQSYADAYSWCKLSEKNGNPILYFANNLRNKFLKIFQDCDMDVQEYGVIAAILLGDSDDLDPDLARSYSATGASHILCVSGLHVGIIYMIIAFFLRFLEKTKRKRIFRSLILLSVIWLYACITGLSPSVARASTMFTFVAIGGLLNRQTNSYNSLLASLIFLLSLNPLLIFSLGFQLSYLAVFGIVWVQKPLCSLYQDRTKIGKYLWEIITVSLAAQLFTAPLAMLYFHQFPNYFLLTNIIVIPLVFIVLVSGISVLTLSFLEFTYKYLSLALMYLVKFINWAITTIESFPYSVTKNIDISIVQVIFIYLLIVLLLMAFFYKKKTYLFGGIFCFIIVMGMDIHKQILVNQQKKIVFYSVNSGYAIDCIDGITSTFFCDSITIKDAQIYDYSIKNNHIYQRLCKIDKLQNQQFISFHGKTILIIDKPIHAIDFDQKLKINYILLHNNLNVSIDILQKMFDFDILLTDGTYSYYCLNYIRKTCVSKMVPYHDLKNHGAMLVKIE